MHDSAVCTNGPPNNVVRVFKINDHRLGWSVCFVVDLAHADILVGLERLQGVVSASALQNSFS